ncbi:TadE/TadG family type IV pilus assembly protein [Streptomyces sp. BPTC-684]|uniref:TadE/TadG family type IV pilus assembly protein n=1 Tax=Streptomyces sp. BPTC-684 TaxID=3043734 RepID=UPI0024B0414F|nr:TadE/TadG family type IV pilus assembly protein [Streptomyces sp. BPTC-684]WHM36879.1 TadE/TadG family type IV pilus assembly protein [Streptomyces sp. BPTC-684]
MRGIRTRADRDRGQIVVEFTGMVPIILVTLAAIWQLVLTGYTYTVAGHVADEGARAGAAKGGGPGACEAAMRAAAPDGWDVGPGCGGGGDPDVFTATVAIKVPVLFPGALSFPFTVHGRAGAAREETP